MTCVERECTESFWESAVLCSERLTGALLDRLTHRVHILTADGESYRLKDARKRGKRSV